MSIEKSHTNQENTFLGLTVVLVDNIERQPSTITNMLTALGFDKIIHASNGAHALNMLFQQSIDLIITAPQLPKDESMQLLKQSRLNPKTSKIPFIIIAEIINQKQVIEAIKYGLMFIKNQHPIIATINPSHFILVLEILLIE